MSSQKQWKNHINKLKKIKIKADKKILKNNIIKAIKKSIPDKKFGILFSGGVDSCLIALICKQLKKDFTCYTVGLENSEDITYKYFLL